ncbi:unnamed protein product [Clonostachys rosea]|uniref:Dystroglycan-type cadherin-like domain-containing protein n=1 Tax=Bionectria ochroleuca TaxID=29856 RepID=A0ABY6U2Z9_BIOOC|nr:unnamed protein product [Clonostachys rosea]
MASPMIWIYFLQLLQLVSCVPIISFPFNAQLPPVARIGRLYSYSFSSYTFQSDSNITYQLRNGPKWLSLDGKDRRLFGIPTDRDVAPTQGNVVGQTFQIIATDATGSRTMDGTIVISREDGPEIKIPVSEQIKRFGSYSAPSSILSYPSTDFSFSFDTNTFAHPSSGINYYASSGNSSPLPAWVKFDATTLRFSGRTPTSEALYQPPQKFDMRLIASDVAGFSSTSIDFSIVVGSHKLSAESPVITLNVSRGTSFKYGGLASSVKLDGKSASSKDLTTTVAALPGWLKFDSETWVIEGMPGKDDRSTNFTVKFTDSFSDTLEVLVMANVATGLFRKTLDEIEATPGERFSLDVAPYLRDPKDIELKMVTKSGQDWLKLDGLEITGDVPTSAVDNLEIRIEATSRSSNVMESELFQVSFRPVDGSTKTLSSATSTASPTEKPHKTSDAADEDEDGSNEHGLGTGALLLATILPILAVCFIVMLLVYLMKRRRMRKSKTSRKDFRDKISKPIVGSLRVTGSGEGEEAFRNMAASNNQASQAEKGVMRHGGSRVSSRSSHTLGSISSSRGLGPHNTGYAPLRDGSSDSDRRSWFTVERVGTGRRSQGSRSDTTGPRSTHQLLPTPPFLSYAGEGAFHGGLEFAIPSLSELPNLQLDPELVSNHPEKPRSAAMFSTITSSSAALPSSRLNSPEVESGFVPTIPSPAITPAPSSLPSIPPPTLNSVSPPPPVPARSRARTLSSGGSVRRNYRQSRTSSDRDWTTIADSDAGVLPDLPPPMPSHQWASRQGTDMSLPRPESSRSKRAKSFITETSFGSAENWRVIGRYDRNAPQLPPPVQGLGHRRSSPDLSASGTGSKLADPAIAAIPIPPEPTSRPASSRPVSRSRYSKLNEDEEKAKEVPASTSAAGWRREDSEKASRGSFAAFI